MTVLSPSVLIPNCMLTVSLADASAANGSYRGKPADAATSLLASLQGGLIVSRAQGDRGLLGTIQRVFLKALGAE